MLTLIITLIETVYTFLWGDLITLPLPGGGTLGLPLLVLLLIPPDCILPSEPVSCPCACFRI
mgnify:CR=1 FL=1